MKASHSAHMCVFQDAVDRVPSGNCHLRHWRRVPDWWVPDVLFPSFPGKMTWFPTLTFLFSAAGRDLLVHPVTEEGATGVTAYLPGKDEVRGPVHCTCKGCVVIWKDGKVLVFLFFVYSLVYFSVFSRFGMTFSPTRSTTEARICTSLLPCPP